MTINYFIGNKKRKYAKVYLRYVSGKKIALYCWTKLYVEINKWPNEDINLLQKLTELEYYIIDKTPLLKSMDKQTLNDLIIEYHCRGSNLKDYITELINKNEREGILSQMSIYNFKHTNRVYSEFCIQEKMDNVLINEDGLDKFEIYLVDKGYAVNTISRIIRTLKHFISQYKGRSEINNQKKVEKTYIIYDSRLYKIGKSINPEKRLHAIRCHNPNVEMIYVINHNVEKELHRKYKNKRVNREWFALSKEDINEIKAILN